MHEHLIGAPPEPYAAQDADLVLDDERGAGAALIGLAQVGRQCAGGNDTD